jgi:hypothetical protein
VDFQEYDNYIGDRNQLYGTRHYCLSEGKSNNVRAIDVFTGGGLQYTVLPDRGLDISCAFYKGKNFTYLTANGETHPAFYEQDENGWLRTFFAGLVTTCGTANIGKACDDLDTSYGLHGRFSITPAKNVIDFTPYEDKIRICGEIDNSILNGEKIKTIRTIESDFYGNTITIKDSTTNYGGSDIPFLMLYHINFGYPFLNENAQIRINSDEVEPYDDYSRMDTDNVMSFNPPAFGVKEKNYLHRMRNINGYGYSLIVNQEDLDYGVLIGSRLNELPYVSQWKSEK